MRWALSICAPAKRTAAVLSVSLTALVAAMLVLTGHDTLAEARSTGPIVSRIVAADGPLRADVPFYTFRMYDQTLPYYLGRTVTQVEHYDELAMGIASEPDKAIATEAEWRAPLERSRSRRTRSCSRTSTSGFETTASRCASSAATRVASSSAGSDA